LGITHRQVLERRIEKLTAHAEKEISKAQDPKSILLVRKIVRQLRIIRFEVEKLRLTELRGAPISSSDLRRSC
jgi:hypothetical protein